MTVEAQDGNTPLLEVNWRSSLRDAHQRNKGFLLIAAASFIFPIENVCVKELNRLDESVPTFQLIAIHMYNLPRRCNLHAMCRNPCTFQRSSRGPHPSRISWNTRKGTRVASHRSISIQLSSQPPPLHNPRKLAHLKSQPKLLNQLYPLPHVVKHHPALEELPLGLLVVSNIKVLGL
ncbi:hypothetical protein IW262DRAFT_1062667 [Armillaria fumosa]|nr:hypothetical protein IW262DRAFT_1062667 [Armillaria fumosa]